MGAAAECTQVLKGLNCAAPQRIDVDVQLTALCRFMASTETGNPQGKGKYSNVLPWAAIKKCGYAATLSAK